MAQYSREQLLDAMRRANEAGDVAAVNELAAKVEEMDKSSFWEQRQAAGDYIPPDFSGRNLEQEFGQAVSQRVSETVPYVGAQAAQAVTGDITTGEALFRSTAGRGVLGTGLDILGETISYGVKKLSEFTPDNYEWAYVNSLKQAVAPLLDNRVAEAAGNLINKGIDGWFTLKQEQPRIAENLEGVFNVAEVWSPSKMTKPRIDLPAASPLVQTADKLYGSSEKITNERRNAFVEEVITPEDNKASRLERQERRVEDPATGVLTVELSPVEVEMREVLKGTPDFGPHRSLTGNQNAIETRIGKIAERLDKRLAASGATINKQDILNDLQTTVDNLAETSPVLVGDAGKVAQRIFSEAERLIKASDGTAVGYLNVRRELDKWIKKQGKDSFDGFENAYSVAQRAVRDVLNTRVAEAAPDVDTLDSLRRQHLLLLSLDRIKPKAAEELDTKLGRLFDNIMRSTGTSLPRTPLARYATIGALGTTLGGAAFAGLLPYLAVGGAGGALGYAVYRGAISPNTRKILAGVLRNTDRAMKATKVPEMKDQLALDRAFIVEIMKLPTSETEDFPELTEEDFKRMETMVPLKPEGM
jgi:hypothetical protein